MTGPIPSSYTTISPMRAILFALATALALGSLVASHVRAQANRPLIPEIVDVTHATKESAAATTSTRR